jgi:hypothetical protein
MEKQSNNQRVCKWEWIGGKLHIHEPLSTSEAFELKKHLTHTLIEKADDADGH